MTTLEQVEKLRALANVSYDEAKAALDASNGDLLEAIIDLEKQGKVNAPTGGGYYSSEKTMDASEVIFNKSCWEKENKNCNNGETFSSLIKKFGKFCLKLLRKSTTNYFEVLKGEQSKASVPVIALVFTIPLLIIGLFFGLRYRFKGPDFSGNTINDAMNSAADAAENLKKSMND
ncbi:Translation elongation factor Ts [Candidatus Desulfosporosinus infrequens]|uniref:Translation elongation factor Ts n=1 Tax=Candidatus Desulfosporosinus infrequens TaxID=2043169 RepID=A0A2U3KTJ6_9FIRM|nr:Translation elongation factor Ts [Candidatus Desulfosporosinus infrequens]